MDDVDKPAASSSQDAPVALGGNPAPAVAVSLIAEDEVLSRTAPRVGNQRWENPFTGLNRQAKLVILTAWMGFLLVALDAGLFTFMYPTVQKALGISLDGIATLFTISFILSAVGSFIFGPLLDRLGRKRIFNITLLFTAVGSALTGAATGLVSLNIYRAIAGLGGAGENDAGQTMVAEVVPAKVRGFWNGFIQTGYPAGYLAAAGLSAVLLPAIGWRWAFVCGIIPAAAIVMARLWVKETPRYEALRRAHKGAELSIDVDGIVARIDVKSARKFEYLQLFQRGLRRNTILICLWQFIYTYGAAGIITWIPTIIIGLNYTQGDVFEVAAIAQFLGLLGYLTAALIGNRVGRREMAAIWLTIGGLSGFVFLIFGTTSLVEIGLVYGMYYFFSIGQMGAAIGFIAEVFPTRVRGSAMSLTYGAGASGGFIVASATGPLTIHGLGYTGSLFLWAGVTSFVAAALAFGTTRVRPGLVLEDIST